MNKKQAIQLLGGTVTAAAEAIGISRSAVSQWPEELPDPIRDRVQAAIARKHLAPEVIGSIATPMPQEKSAQPG